MITGLIGASIWSADLNNLLPFYRDTLGLKVFVESPGFVVLGEAGAATLGIGTHSQVQGQATDPYRHNIGLRTDDLDADYQRLSAVGVTFIEAPTAYEGLRLATLLDPEGNLVQLIETQH